MSVESKKKYFVVVFGRESLKDILKKENIEGIDENTSRSKLDDSIWINRFIGYDYKHEFSGIMRLPELNFLDLWDLLLFSKIESNRIGALLVIEELYGAKLLNVLTDVQESREGIRGEQRRAIKLIKEYSLPFGAFHWLRNKNLNESDKRKVYDTWAKIESIVNDIIIG